MAPFRNFLSRKSTAPPNGGEVTASDTNASSHLSLDSHASTPMSIRQSTDNNEPPEYKLSVVDANGIYHPPSPPEKASIWRKYPGSPKSSHSHHRDLVDENEPFSISRESFDSYRRSFVGGLPGALFPRDPQTQQLTLLHQDISARSPICYSDAMPSRTSLDSRVSRMTSLSSAGLRKQPETMEEEQFEEVGLDDEEVKPKRKSIFSRFGDFTTTSDSPSTSSTSKTSSLGFHIPGRKRGQSNVGSELGTFQGPPETDVRDA